MTVSPAPPSVSSAPRVLLVEDDDVVRRSLHLLLRGQGFDVRSYARAHTLTDDAGVGEAAYLIADYRLADGDGIGVLRGLRRRGWQGRAVMVTGHYSATLCDAAMAGGFDVVLEKPLKPGQLLATLAAR